MKNWYVIRSKPNKEFQLWSQLEAHGFESYLPCISVAPVNPRARRKIPYFSGYLFVKCDLDESGFSVLQWMPYSMGLVSFGGELPPVQDELLNLIQKKVNGLVLEKPKTQFRPGSAVEIERGPFNGYKAIFDSKISGTERARVFLKLLQNRQLELDLPVNYLRLERA